MIANSDESFEWDGSAWVAAAAPEPAAEYVVSFPQDFPADLLDQDAYRPWLARLRFRVETRTREIGINKRPIVQHVLIDPTDGEVMGRMQQAGSRIMVSLNVRTVNTTTGKPGCNLRDTFACVGTLTDAGPWTLQRVPPCRKGCAFCVAPDTLTIERTGV